jgi:hypothetical protein
MLHLTPPHLQGVIITLAPPATLRLTGTLATKDPSICLGRFLAEVHQTAIRNGESQVCVDVSGLTFVNSSAIRLFVDWVTWVRQEQPANRYRLQFLTDNHITWQKTSFRALKSLATDVVSVESASDALCPWQ